ncbi:hypothetical protein SISSUDRAFT_1035031 [Sistotremastrum suecicum HHB10207 ss-3]|uniref:F-box domain-containing protein n=1 Tax=Sistotremastrum suecicum HHB10207 ss-3 TaxID=1314776 RepID=A0A166BCB3_9AGAM|nr:hypothetical protein SISSUDRAFT_1035031 [Sistotremastrum suecicum HHB10207 ss-3]
MSSVAHRTRPLACRFKMNDPIPSRLMRQANALNRRRWPIAILPNEILTYIFKLWFESYSPYICLPELSVACVCRHWRRLALGERQLWSKINLTWCDELIDIFAERSSPSLLTLSIPYYNYALPLWAIDFVKTRVDRIQKIRIPYWMDSLNDPEVQSPDIRRMLNQKFPALEELEITFPRVNPEIPPINVVIEPYFMEHNFPVLTHLSLSRLPGMEPWISSNRLRYLNLDLRLFYQYSITPEESLSQGVYSILCSNSSSLEELILTGDLARRFSPLRDWPKNDLHLECLRVLKLKALMINWIPSFFERVLVPVTTRFSMECWDPFGLSMEVEQLIDGEFFPTTYIPCVLLMKRSTRELRFALGNPIARMRCPAIFIHGLDDHKRELFNITVGIPTAPPPTSLSFADDVALWEVISEFLRDPGFSLVKDLTIKASASTIPAPEWVFYSIGRHWGRYLQSLTLSQLDPTELFDLFEAPILDVHPKYQALKSLSFEKLKIDPEKLAEFLDKRMEDGRPIESLRFVKVETSEAGFGLGHFQGMVDHVSIIDCDPQSDSGDESAEGDDEDDEDEDAEGETDDDVDAEEDEDNGEGEAEDEEQENVAYT